MRRVATVAGRPIPITRLEARIAEVRRGRLGRHLPPEGGVESVRIRRWIAQELVNQELLAHEARLAGAPGEASDAVRARVFERVTRDVHVSERDIRAYYRRNRDLYCEREVRRIRHVLYREEHEPCRVALREAAGKVAMRGASDLDLRRGEFAGPLEEAVFAAHEGDLVGPIQSELGWHVARVERITPARRLPFSMVRASIRAELRAAARLRAFDEWLDGRQRTLVVMEPAFEHPDHPIHGMPRHRH